MLRLILTPVFAWAGYVLVVVVLMQIGLARADNYELYLPQFLNGHASRSDWVESLLLLGGAVVVGAIPWLWRGSKISNPKSPGANS